MAPTTEKTVRIKYEADLSQLQRSQKELSGMLRTTFSKKTFNDLMAVNDKISDTKSKIFNLNSLSLGRGILPKNFDKGFTDINSEVKSLGTVAKGTKSILGNTYTSMDKAVFSATVKLREQNRAEVLALKTSKDLFKSLGIGATLVSSKVAPAFEDIDKMMKRVTKNARNTFKQTPFQGWALSIMFAGMALQRTSSQIMTFGTKAFDEISHSVRGTVTATDRFNASMTMLGFSIGDALQGLIEFMIPVIESITEFVEKNPALVASLVGIATVLGTLATLGGGLTLAAVGIKDMAGAVSFLTSGVSVAGLESIGAAFGTIALPLLAIAAVFLAINKAWNDSAVFRKETVDGILKPIAGAFTDLFDALSDVWDALKDLVIFDMIGGMILGLARGLGIILTPVIIAFIRALNIAVYTVLAFFSALQNDPVGVKKNLSNIKDELYSIGEATANAISQFSNLSADLSNGGALSLSKQIENMNTRGTNQELDALPESNKTIVGGSGSGYQFYIQTLNLSDNTSIKDLIGQSLRGR